MVSLSCSSPQLAETKGKPGEWRDGEGEVRREKGTDTKIEKHRKKEREEKWRGGKNIKQ